MQNTTDNTTGKDMTMWEALNEVEDEDILHFMEAIQAIGIFLDCRKEYDLYEYRRALQGWSDLNNAFSHEAQARIEQYADIIESD